MAQYVNFMRNLKIPKQVLTSQAYSYETLDKINKLWYNEYVNSKKERGNKRVYLQNDFCRGHLYTGRKKQVQL